MIRALLAGAILAAPPALAGSVTPVEYDDMAAQLSGHVDFESYPTLPEPGLALTGPLVFPGLSIGARLRGQSIESTDGFELLTGQPTLPLIADIGGKAAVLAVAFHAGFGSTASFPLGPGGFAQRSGRGEGALAFVFDGTITGFALKLHADYADPLGARPQPGPVMLTFFAPSGHETARHTVTPAHGVTKIAVQVTPPAAAITLTHRDPGGIAIDDIRYSLDSLGS